MRSSLSAELLKLRKRTASWVLVLLVALTGYILLYLNLENTTPPQDLSAEKQQAFEEAIAESNAEYLRLLLPQKVLVNVLNTLSNGTGILALVFGALAFGSEYNWGTLKTVLSRRPAKTRMFAGKVLAVLVYFALFSVLAFVVGGVCSYFVAVLEGASAGWPPVWRTVEALAAGWLIFAVWGMLGAFLAILLRSASLAIGLGLGYAIVIEQTVVSFGASVQNDAFQSALKALPGTNSAALVTAFGDVPQGFSLITGEAVGPGQAALVLGVYVVALTTLTVLLFQQRDVE